MDGACLTADGVANGAGVCREIGVGMEVDAIAGGGNVSNLLTVIIPPGV